MATTSAALADVALETLRSMASVPERFAPDVLLSELEIDSLDLVELIQTVEDECDLRLDLGVLKGVESVGDVVNFLAATAR